MLLLIYILFLPEQRVYSSRAEGLLELGMTKYTQDRCTLEYLNIPKYETTKGLNMSHRSLLEKYSKNLGKTLRKFTFLLLKIMSVINY